MLQHATEKIIFFRFFGNNLKIDFLVHKGSLNKQNNSIYVYISRNSEFHVLAFKYYVTHKQSAIRLQNVHYTNIQGLAYNGIKECLYKLLRQLRERRNSRNKNITRRGSSYCWQKLRELESNIIRLTEHTARTELITA
jgi:hypothetical protein